MIKAIIFHYNSKCNCQKKYKMHECYSNKIKHVDESMECIFLPKIPKAALTVLYAVGCMRSICPADILCRAKKYFNFLT